MDRLPRRLGDALYHGVQKFTARTPKEEYNFQQPTLAKFVTVLDSLQLSFMHREVVEIGSGWLPVLPYDLVFKHGATRVFTYDINKHYNPETIARFNHFYGIEFSIHLGKELSSQVLYHPNTDICGVNFQRNSIGAMVTRNVLEHVEPSVLENIHRQALEYIKEDGFIIHQISPSDHRAYTDQSLSLWDFLRYSKEEWNKVQTRFDYHNRLRLPQYLDIFRKTGFEVKFLSYKAARPGQSLPERIHNDFKGFTVEELTAGNIIVVLKPIRR